MDLTSPLFVVAYALNIIVAVFLAMILHQVGHVLFGMLLGMKLEGFRLFVFRWRFLDGKIKYSFDKSQPIALTYKMEIPAHFTEPFDFLLYIAGGLFFNLIFAAVFILLAVVGNKNSMMILAIYAFMNLIVFYASAKRDNKTPMPSDGSVIMSIIRRTDLAKKLVQVNLISAAYSAGARPRDLVIPDITVVVPDMFDVMLLYQIYYHALDTHNEAIVTGIIRIFEDNLDKLQPLYFSFVYWELTFYYARNINTAKAKEYFGRSMANPLLEPISRERILAYYSYYINNDITSAREYAAKGLEVSTEAPYKGLAAFETDLIKSLLDRMEKAGH